MRALTLHQPWASLIACGAKLIETRIWPPYQDCAGELIAIHAGATEHRRFRKTDPQVLTLLGTQDLPVQAILAVAVIRDWLPTQAASPGPAEQHLGDYSPGRWAWRLAHIRPLAEPLPCKGHHKLWTVPQDLLPLIQERLLPPVALDPHPPVPGSQPRLAGL